MNKRRLTIAAASAALLLGTAAIGAQARDIKANLGGINATVSIGGKNAAQARTNVGNAANANVTVGGGRGNVASAKANVGNNNVTANVGKGGGSLVNSNTRGSPLGGGGLTSNTSVNLGGLFGGGGGGGGGNGPGPGPGPGGGGDGGGPGIGGGNGNGGGGGGNGGGRVVPIAVQAAISDMSTSEVAVMKRRCASVLLMPTGYDRGLIDLCRVLQRL